MPSLEDRCREWFAEHQHLVCYGNRPGHDSTFDPSQCPGCIADLLAFVRTLVPEHTRDTITTALSSETKP